MRNKSGFTIIEVLIVTIIIAILASITIVAYTKVQGDARNNTRKGNAITIANSLETYYNKNGEYPSTRSLANSYPANTGSSIAAFLSIPANTLVNPQMPSGATNSLSSIGPPANDYITYTGASSVNASDCQNNLTGGCDSFTLQYNQEAGPIVTITSRHNGRSTNFGSIPNAVVAPTLSATSLGANVVATAFAAACENAGLTAKFSYQYQVNGGPWSGYNTWSASTTYSVAGVGGSNYTFQAVTRCDNGPVPGLSSPPSSTASTVFPVAPPSTPTLTIGPNGGNVQATVTNPSCAAGATEVYQFTNRVNNGSWTAWSAWSASTSASQSAAQGSKYDYAVQAMCQGGGLNSSVVGGSTVTYIAPISAPAAPTLNNTGTTYYNNDTAEGQFTWYWNATSCPAGTTAVYEERDYVDFAPPYDSGLGSYSYMNSSYTSNLVWTWEGQQYTIWLGTACTSPYTTSPWSGLSSRSYITPVATPSAPYSFNGAQSSGNVHWTWSWGYCGDVNTESIVGYSYNAPGNMTVTGVNNWASYINLGGSGNHTQVEGQSYCQNGQTGRSGSWGPMGVSGIVNVP